MVRTKDRLLLSKGLPSSKRVVVEQSDDIATDDADAHADTASHNIKSLPIPKVSDDPTIDTNDQVDAEAGVIAVVRTLSNADVDTTDGGKTESKKRKPLPAGYICRACGEVGMHAIYECPLKVPLKKIKTAATAADATSSTPAVVVVDEVEEATGSRDDDSAHLVQKSNRSNKDTQQHQVKEATDGTDLSQPRTSSLSTKHVVFITGLPFSCKHAEVIAVFQSEGIGSDLSRKDVRLVMFDDSPQRCKGLAYVTFHSEDDYRMALALTNRTMAGRTLSIEVCKPNKPTAIAGGNSHSHGDSGRGSRKYDNPLSSSSSSSSSFGKKKSNSSSSSSRRCYRCGMLHDVNQCTNKRICYRCKSTEHLSSQCPMKKKSQ